jgi:uncharacterized protein
MTIDWVNFSPYTALAGGMLIGLAAALMLLLNGRIMGISGIIGGVKQKDAAWRVAFILGVILAPLLWRLLGQSAAGQLTVSTWQIVIGGFLVGLGTRYGSGCTSGHGVCGLSRGSPRSLVATLSFMGAGFLTVFVLRHLA